MKSRVVNSYSSLQIEIAKYSVKDGSIDKEYGQDGRVLINHEKIHLRQQLELLIIPFYFLYGINYLLNLLKYKNHYQAYLNIVFEKEAYKFEKDPNYLSKRKWYNWINFYSA